MSSGQGGGAPRWAARPWAAWVLRAFVTLAPLAASVGFVFLASMWVPAPEGSTLSFLLWWLALSAAGSVVLLAADRAARRLLPLTALLRLSLVFPDAAPSRFRAALDAGRVRRLEDRLRLIDEARAASTPRESAERLLTLVAALSEHDKLTRGHSERVRAYSVMIGEELHLDKEELDLLNWAALLHDVGKLDVPGEILRKPGRPTDEEWQQIRSHPQLGEELVKPIRGWLGSWADAVGYHHERWDGKGYPRGLEADRIPLPGRIVAVADVFDVVTSARSYKEAGSAIDGRAEIAACAGTQFDPRVVRAFLGVSLGRMRLVMGPLSWIAHTPVLGRLPLAPAAGTVWTAAVGMIAAAAGLVGTMDQPRDAAALANSTSRIAPAPALPADSRPAEHPRTAREPAESGEAPATSAPTAEPAPHTAAPAPEADAKEEPPSRDDAPAPAPDAPADPITDPLVPPVSGMTVNDAPSFAGGGDQYVLEDAGPQSVTRWARAISAGPASEAGQTVSFDVNADDPGLFSEQPRISPSGTLSYRPAPDASGVATVTVRATDNGGTAKGGRDTSGPSTLTIAVAALNDAPGFAAGPDQSPLEDAGPQTVAGWAGSVSAGAPDESGQALAFEVTNDDPALFSAQPQIAPDGTLTYTPAPDTSGSATVTVRLTDDGGSALGGVDTSATRTFAIAVVEVNDAPGFTAGADELVLVDSGPQTVPGWAASVSPGPPAESSQAVSFDVSSDNPALFGAQPQVAPNGTLTYTTAAGATGAATVTVSALDDGGTAFGGDDSSAPQTFTIIVTEVNDPPSFTAGADQSVLEDAGPQALGAWATGISPGPSSEAGQAVSFSVSNTNPALFSAQPQVAPNGTLTYTPAANASGAATVTVGAVDDGGTAFGGDDSSAPQTFTIIVTEVNDPPSFTAGGSQTVLLGLTQQTVAGWATGISAGPPAEAGQTVTFTVTGNSNPGLFAVQPQVAPNGTLTYTPAFLALGAATLTVTAVDNGGAANGGADTSAPRSLSITIIVG